MADTTNFKVDVKNYLGLENSAYKSRMMQIALTNPTNFYKIRENVLKNVIENAIGDLYDTLYNVMTSGLVKIGGRDVNASSDGGAVPAGGDAFRPQIPKQQVSEFALKAAKTLEDIVREAVEIMLPEDFLDLAKARIARTSDARGINV